MASRNILVTLTVCLIVLLSESADACTCLRPGAPCEAASGTDAVFVGHVVSIEWSPTGGRVAQLAVTEAFRGLQLSQVMVLAGADTCGYSFRMGESYVVYAHRTPEGQFSTSICTRTRPVANAADDLTYLRSLAAIAPGRLARFVGRVQLWEWPQPPGIELKRVPGVTVTATGEEGTFSALTDDRGEFELTGLPLGKYEVVAKAPDGYEGVPRAVEIHDPRGCGTTVLYINYDGRVIGRVIDREGRGIRGLPIELLSTDVEKPVGSRYPVQAWTAADGTFELKLVAPGQYVLAFASLRGRYGQLKIPGVVYPGVTEPTKGATIDVSIGERVRLRDFVVPDGIPLVAVAGVVVDEAGRPVRDASIVLRRADENPNFVRPPLVTGDDGRFTFAVVEGGKYNVQVTRHAGSNPGPREIQVAEVSFTAAAEAPLVTVVMKPNRY